MAGVRMGVQSQDSGEGIAEVSPTRIATAPDRSPCAPEAHSRRRTGAHLAGGGGNRDRLLERLQQLRRVLPVFAQEVAGVRRQTAALRIENRGLLEEVRRLRAQRGESDDAPRRSLDPNDGPTHSGPMELEARRGTDRELDGVAG